MTEKRSCISWVHHIGKVRDFLIIMIRQNFPFLYAFLDSMNNIYGHIFFRGFKKSLKRHSWEGIYPGDTVEIITENDVARLVALIQSASEKSKSLFNPHAINEDTFKQMIRAPYYLAIGYYISGELSGYAFLKLYFPWKAFAGYYVADAHQRKGIGTHLFKILKSVISETTLTLYTFVKEENFASIHVSSDFIIEQKMPGGYMVLKHLVNKKP